MSSTIGEKIKYARKINGLTQKELGNKLGVTEAQVCHIEKGNRKLQPEIYAKAKEILKFDFDFEIPISIKTETSKVDKLYNIIKFLFATPDNYKQIEDIWNN